MAKTMLAMIAVCVALLAAGRAQAATEAVMLNTCQKAVGTAAANFVKGKETAISACLNAVSAAIIGKQGSDATAAAKTCVAQFRLINDSRALGKSLPEKLAAAIAKSCNPNAPLTQGDVLGSPSSLAQTLEVADQLGEWCAAFGGNGTIATVSDWTMCVNSAAECAVDTAISTQYPRALEWLAAVRVKMNGLTPPAGDLSQISDAVAALDAVKAAIDGPNSDSIPSPACGQGGQLLTCQNDLTSCDADLTSCTTSLGTCNGNLTSCNTNYSTCNTNLGTCTGSLTTCTSNLGTVNAGTATPADVLSGKTFSSSAGLGVTGTVPAGANVNGGNGLKTFTIPDGLYSGSKTATANDTNLAAGNIVKGVSILGVTGTQPPSQPLRTGQTTTYGTGSDAGSLKGDVRSLTDNGDGTITDNKTGLMWEKKDQAAGGIHNWNNTYTWGMTYSPYTMNGTMVTTFLATLNAGSGFAGHSDWRIPNLNELQSIANYQNVNPAVDAAFNTGCAASCTVLTCSCTQSNYYWSSTTYQNIPSNAWVVGFYDGYVVNYGRSNGNYVRAVRGGS